MINKKESINDKRTLELINYEQVRKEKIAMRDVYMGIGKPAIKWMVVQGMIKRVA